MEARYRSERHRKKQRREHPPITLIGLFKRYWVFLCAALIVVVSTVLLYAGLETAHMAGDTMERVQAGQSEQPMDIIDDVNKQVYAEAGEAEETQGKPEEIAYQKPDYEMVVEADTSEVPISAEEIEAVAGEAVRYAALLLDQDLSQTEVRVTAFETPVGAEAPTVADVTMGKNGEIFVGMDLTTGKPLMLAYYPETAGETGEVLSDEAFKRMEKECVVHLKKLVELYSDGEEKVTNVVNLGLLAGVRMGEQMEMNVFLDNGQALSAMYWAQGDGPVFTGFGYMNEEEAAQRREYIESQMPELLW